MELYDATIEDSYRKQIEVDGFTYLVEILDTAGQEEYTAMRDQYYRLGEGFVLVYDINKRSSFDEMASIRDRIYEYKFIELKTKKIIPIMIVGNKTDLQFKRQVSTQEGKYMADLLQCKFTECCAKNHQEVVRLWTDLIREVVNVRNPKIYKRKPKSSCVVL